jgi:hypothetical protein
MRTMLAHDLHYLCVMRVLKTRLLQGLQIVVVVAVVLAVGRGEEAKNPDPCHPVQLGLAERSV